MWGFWAQGMSGLWGNRFWLPCAHAHEQAAANKVTHSLPLHAGLGSLRRGLVYICSMTMFRNRIVKSKSYHPRILNGLFATRCKPVSPLRPRVSLLTRRLPDLVRDDQVCPVKFDCTCTFSQGSRDSLRRYEKLKIF